MPEVMLEVIVEVIVEVIFRDLKSGYSSVYMIFLF